MEKLNRSIVLISDIIDNHNNADISTRTLEFTEEKYYKDLVNCLRLVTSRDLYIYNNIKEFEGNIDLHKEDVVFSTYSGINSRNRKSFVAALCEINNIIYLGADIFVQTLCQNKYLSKLYLADMGFNVPFGLKLTKNNPLAILENISYPAIIKPNNEGGSIGISSKNLVSNIKEAYQLYGLLINKYEELLIEEYIPGNEINILICGNGKDIFFCEPYKMVINGVDSFDNYIYSLEDKKMLENTTAETYVNIKEFFNADIISLAKEVFIDLGKVDILRIDGRLYNNNFFVIELSPDVYIGKDSNIAQMYYENGYSYVEMALMMLKKLIEK